MRWKESQKGSLLILMDCSANSFLRTIPSISASSQPGRWCPTCMSSKQLRLHRRDPIRVTTKQHKLISARETTPRRRHSVCASPDCTNTFLFSNIIMTGHQSYERTYFAFIHFYYNIFSRKESFIWCSFSFTCINASIPTHSVDQFITAFMRYGNIRREREDLDGAWSWCKLGLVQSPA